MNQIHSAVVSAKERIEVAYLFSIYLAGNGFDYVSAFVFNLDIVFLHANQNRRIQLSCQTPNQTFFRPMKKKTAKADNPWRKTKLGKRSLFGLEFHD
jgi:hypothetical protein